MSKRITSLLILIIFVFGMFSNVSALEKIGPLGEADVLYYVATPEDDPGTDPDPGDDPDPEDKPDPDPEPAPEASISFNNPPDTLTVGTKQQINVTLKNAPANTNVRWASSNSDVATVDSDGNVTAVSPGKVEISASVPETNAKTSTLIEIVAPQAKSIKITSKELSAADLLLSVHPVVIGDVLHLDFEIDPKDAEKTEVTWASDNEAVLTVTAEGVVTAVAEGNATVTLTMGDLADTMTFKVAKEKDKFGFLIYISIGLLLIAIIIIIVMLVRRSKRKKAELEEQKRKLAQMSRQGQQMDNSIRQNSANIEAMQNQGKYTDDRTMVFTPELDTIDPFADDPLEDASDEEETPAPEAPHAGIDDLIDVDSETDYLNKDGKAEVPLQKDEPFSLDDID